MKLQVHWNGLTANPTLQDHLERRLAFALGRFGEEVSRVCVRLADMNGPKGGVDKLVRLRVVGRRLTTVIITDSDADLSAAIDRASDRLGRAVGRALERVNDRGTNPDLARTRARTPRRR